MITRAMILSTLLAGSLLHALAPAPPAAGPWVTRADVLDAPDAAGLQFDCIVTLTDALQRDEKPPTPVRLLTVSVGARWQHVLLEHQLVLRGASPGSSEPIFVEVGDVDLANGPVFAKQALGLDWTPTAPVPSPRYRLGLSPRAGLTWNEVAAPEDLLVTLTPD